MNLARSPRVRLAHFPTPLERLDRLSAALGGPEIWIKRDDCTGLATGGNKSRKLEFLMGAALEAGADMVMTHGARQSNHARQTAAAKLGLDCHLVLEDRLSRQDPDYRHNGNVLLDVICGATIESTPPSNDMNGVLEQAAEKFRAQGRKVYTIPGGGSNAIGALGYVNAAFELAQQLNDEGLVVDHIVHATGSAGTQAGMVAGLAAINSDIPVLGIGVRTPRPVQEANVLRLGQATLNHMGLSITLAPETVVANCDYVGEGYGIPTRATLEAIELVARTEGILLDPVYSGKGMAGLVDLIRTGKFEKAERIVFLHTGGSAGLFGYPSDFAPVS